MERNESYPVYANNVKQAIDALSESGSTEIPNDLEEAAIEYSAIGYSPFDDPYEKHQQFECSKLVFIDGAKWQKERDDKELSEKIAAAYQLGLTDKEKMMMKNPSMNG